MSKCAFYNCNEQHSGSKQFNSHIVRIYLCTKHLLLSAKYDGFTHSDGDKFLKLIEESKE